MACPGSEPVSSEAGIPWHPLLVLLSPFQFGPLPPHLAGTSEAQ